MPSSAPEAVAEVDVGERLRAIRSLRRATLRTIADRAGVSESFLSQVERGKASASIASGISSVETARTRIESTFESLWRRGMSAR